MRNRDRQLDQHIAWATTTAQLRAIDEWRRQQPDLPSRSEAIRRLVDIALRAEGGPGPGLNPGVTLGT
jgi:hypothetical protein